MASYTLTAIINNSTSGIGLTATKRWVATGPYMDVRTVSIAASETTVTLNTDIGNAHYVVVKNNDWSKFVEIGFAPAAYTLKLLAGDVAVLPVAPATDALYMKANADACLVTVYGTEV